MGEGYERPIRTADTRQVYPRCSPKLDSWGYTARIAWANPASWCLSVPKPRMARAHQISLPGPHSAQGQVPPCHVTWRQRGPSRLFSKWKIWARDDGEGTDQDHLPMTFWVWPHHLLVHRAADSTTQGLGGPDPVPSSTSATSLPILGSASPSVQWGQP